MAIALVGAGVVSGATLTGSFNTEINVKKTPIGPLQIGFNGSLGEAEKVLADATQSSGSSQLVVGEAFNGPTAEEKAVLDELAAAQHGVQLALRQSFDAASEAMGGTPPPKRPVEPVPDGSSIMLMRHLTPYELQMLKRAATDLRRSAEQLKSAG